MKDRIERLEKALAEVMHEASREETPKECLARDQFAAMERRVELCFEAARRGLEEAKEMECISIN